MAEKNKKIDPNAKDLGKETVYMYMSHFIDIPTGILTKVDPSISEDGYFSLYITNDDRAAYDLYFQKQRVKRNIEDVYEGIKNLKDICNPKVYKDLVNIENIIRTVFTNNKNIFELIKRSLKKSQNVNEMYNLEKSYKDIGDKVKRVINNEYTSNDPDIVMKNLENDLELKNYNSFYRDFIINSTVSFIDSFASGGIFALPNMAGLLIDQTVYVFSDIYDKANWLSLIQYTNMRVANRIMRAWDM